MRVRNDKTGTLNSYDSAKDFTEDATQVGSCGNNEITIKEGNEATGTTTHETDHMLGIAHFEDGGTIGMYSDSKTVTKANITESLAGVGIGGNNQQRNAKSSVGDGTLLNNSSNTGLGQGKLISAKRYERIMRRLEKKNN